MPRRGTIVEELDRAARTGTPYRRRLAGPLAHDAEAPRRGPTDPFWYHAVGERNASGFHVSPESALRVGAVFRAVRLLADDIAALPLQFVRRLPDRAGGLPGGKEKIRDGLWELLNRRPNVRQTAFEFKQMQGTHLLLNGNGYARIVSGSRGFAEQLLPLHPRRVRPELLSSGRVLYLYRRPDGREERIVQDDMFHLRGFSTNPEDPAGMSPVTLARTSIGLSMATESYGASQFGSAPRPSMAITSPNKIDKERRLELGKSFKRAWSGPSGWHGVPVMDHGMSLTALGMSHDDAQFLETREFQVTDVARWFGVPPHMIGDLKRATFSNIEQQSIDYVTHSLLPWLVLWEGTIERDLVLDDRRAKFQTAALMRGDLLSRSQAYQVQANTRSLTPNEIRDLEDRNPVPWGDEPLQPQGAAPAPASPPGPSRGANRLEPQLNGHRRD